MFSNNLSKLSVVPESCSPVSSGSGVALFSCTDKREGLNDHPVRVNLFNFQREPTGYDVKGGSILKVNSREVQLYVVIIVEPESLALIIGAKILGVEVWKFYLSPSLSPPVVDVKYFRRSFEIFCKGNSSSDIEVEQTVQDLEAGPATSEDNALDRALSQRQVTRLNDSICNVNSSRGTVVERKVQDLSAGPATLEDNAKDRALAQSRAILLNERSSGSSDFECNVSANSTFNKIMKSRNFKRSKIVKSPVISVSVKATRIYRSIRQRGLVMDVTESPQRRVRELRIAEQTSPASLQYAARSPRLGHEDDNNNDSLIKTIIRRLIIVMM